MPALKPDPVPLIAVSQPRASDRKSRRTDGAEAQNTGSGSGRDCVGTNRIDDDIVPGCWSRPSGPFRRVREAASLVSIQEFARMCSSTSEL